jgi:hypothetical protein
MQSRFARFIRSNLRRADKFAQQKFQPAHFVNNISPAKNPCLAGPIMLFTDDGQQSSCDVASALLKKFVTRFSRRRQRVPFGFFYIDNHHITHSHGKI